MNPLSNFVSIQCPFCWETFEIQVFTEDGLEQEFVTDCEICCHPMSLHINFEDELSSPQVTITNTEGGAF